MAEGYSKDISFLNWLASCKRIPFSLLFFELALQKIRSLIVGKVEGTSEESIEVLLSKERSKLVVG